MDFLNFGLVDEGIFFNDDIKNKGGSD